MRHESGNSFSYMHNYAPGLTNNVQQLCWKRAYIVVTHGGGASMITLINDTALHKYVRQNFIDLQSARMLHKTRTLGCGLVDCTAEENLELMITVMSDKDVHRKAAKAYKHIGTTNVLDGN